jgi:hypothetical protein
MPLAPLLLPASARARGGASPATPAPHVHALCLCSAATTEHPKLRKGFITSLLHTQVCS